MILVGDADMIFDHFALRTMQTIFGNISQPMNGNLNFAQNAVEQMAGDSNLIGVRSRATQNRPFERVKQMEAAAQGRFRTLYFYSLSRLARESVITMPIDPGSSWPAPSDPRRSKAAPPSPSRSRRRTSRGVSRSRVGHGSVPPAYVASDSLAVRLQPLCQDDGTATCGGEAAPKRSRKGRLLKNIPHFGM